MTPLDDTTRHEFITLLAPSLAREDQRRPPEQQSRWLDDGRFELGVPYSSDKELIMDSR